MSVKTRIDEALAEIKAAAHGHGLDALTRQHLEFAGAHLRAAWIAEDGQTAETPAETHENVARFYRMQERLAGKFAEARARNLEVAQ